MRRHTTRRTTALALVASACLLVAACSDDEPESTTDTTESTDDMSTTAPEGGDDMGGDDTGDGTTARVTVKVAETSLGDVLVDGDGLTLYAFTPDSPTESACTDACANAWPPVLVSGEPTGDGVDDLGTITRDDGTQQLTVNGHPLYRYAGDAKAGDTTGHGIGDQWFVVDADGELVQS